ncbi:MAG: hypothetical protein GY862_36050 [Gammaproteobacteria bacterium]|nr:hypothetical protein [Gammaproteobacteria bacterium]
MATPFSRTIRSLETDHGHLSRLGLLIAILVAVMWSWWFFTAQLISYEVSRKIYITDKENFVSRFGASRYGRRIQNFRRQFILAEFSPQAMENIHPGQKAFVRLAGTAGKATGAIPAVVIKVKTGPKKGNIELRAEIDAAAPDPFKEGEGGEVKIEVKNITPAVLVLRASGLLTESPPVSASPQAY